MNPEKIELLLWVMSPAIAWYWAMQETDNPADTEKTLPHLEEFYQRLCRLVPMMESEVSK